MPHTESIPPTGGGDRRKIQPTSEGSRSRRRGRSQFSDLVAARKTELATQQQEAAARAEEAETRRQRIAAIILEKQRRDSIHRGTPVESVWGTGEARICREFLDYMQDQGYPLSLDLCESVKEPVGKGRRTTYQEKVVWSMRGYQIGQVPRNLMDPYDEAPGNVYLCQDGELRRSVTRKSGYGINRKIVYQGLDLDEGGNPIPPTTGYVIGNLVSRNIDADDKLTSPGWDMVYRLDPRPLAELLVNYAAGIDLNTHES